MNPEARPRYEPPSEGKAYFRTNAFIILGFLLTGYYLFTAVVKIMHD